MLLKLGIEFLSDRLSEMSLLCILLIDFWLKLWMFMSCVFDRVMSLEIVLMFLCFR